MNELINPTHRAPSFMIIGAVKCGTSSLFQWLAKHPDITAPARKELVFFDQDNQYQKGIDYYHSQFPPLVCGEDKISFESSPAYLYSKKAAHRLFQYNSNLKFIILLRDPINRAYSHWNMYRIWRERNVFFGEKYDEMTRIKLKNLFDSSLLEDFEKIIQYEMNILASQEEAAMLVTFLQHGFYYQHIMNYLNFFQKTQLLILDSHELKNSRTKTLKKVTDFLNISSFDNSVEQLPLFHVLEYQAPLAMSIRKRLSEFYKKHNEQLYHLLDCDFKWA